MASKYKQGKEEVIAEQNWFFFKKTGIHSVQLEKA